MASGVETTAANAWVESYLSALLTFGLSGEYASSTTEGKGPNADRSVYSRYYVRSLLNLDEEALKNAWSKAASSTKHGGEKDARLQYLSWRIWHLKRKQKQVEADRSEDEAHLEQQEEVSDDEAEGEDKSKSFLVHSAGKGLTSHTKVEEREEKPGRGEFEKKVKGDLEKKLSIRTKFERDGTGDVDAMVEDYLLSPQDVTPHSAMASESGRPDRLYVVMISLHGLVRGDRMELGRDSDTGGQVKYVVELAKAMSLHPSVYRVDLLTRMIKDPKVDSDYGEPEECIAKGRGELGGSYIIRLPCGPTNQYIPKEQLWPHVREFADRGIQHVNKMLQKMAESGRRCDLYCIHGHYADAGEAAVLMCSTLGVPQVTTGHSLGRNKLEHLLSSGGMTRNEIEMTYKISRRIEAEERCLDVATLVFTSTQQEVDEQWGLYDGYTVDLARILRFRTSCGRHMPLMKVSPPGLDFSNLKVKIPEDPVVKEFEEQRAAMAGNDFPSFSPLDESRVSSPLQIQDKETISSDHEAVHALSPLGKSHISNRSIAGSLQSLTEHQGPRAPDIIPNGPPIWQDIARYLRNPLKPAVLAMSRPDSKKNITTLVKAFGEHAMLRELANLVLIMGNRDNIDSMPSGSQKVLVQVLKLIDAHDLYGSVAYPKHHQQTDISDIYLFARETRGVFVNIALQEPFGLTVIEAAAHGVPTVATCNGGPVDIMATLHHGVVVDPTDSDAVAGALLSILTSPETWDTMSSSGVKNIMSYSWPAHCKRYMETMEHEYRLIKSTVNQARTMTGFNRRRMSRLDLFGIADMDGVPPSPGGIYSDDQIHEHHRQLSTPGDISPLLSGQVTPRGLTRKPSGVAADDMSILNSMKMEAALQRVTGRLNGRKQKYIVLILDSNAFYRDVAAMIKKIEKEIMEDGMDSVVGIGILSMLGFESTHDLLDSEGVDESLVKFIICNSGADIWFNEEGQWVASEEYEKLITYNWDRVSLHRMLKKIISARNENSQRLPKLKELLYNVGEEPEEGAVHPRHICLELDPETQQILASGMGPKARSTEYLRFVAIIVSRLKKRLRTKGFRGNYTLQLVPDEEKQHFLCVLHITPIRASRPLALRWIAQTLGLNMSDFTVSVTPACLTGDTKLDSLIVPWTSDVADLVGGMQQVQVVVPNEASTISAPTSVLKGLDDALGIPLWPWKDVDRVQINDSDNVTSLLKMVLHQ